MPRPPRDAVGQLPRPVDPQGALEADPRRRARSAKKAARSTELYQLDSDLAETNNLARQHPEMVKELTALLDQIRESGQSRTTGK